MNIKDHEQPRARVSRQGLIATPGIEIVSSGESLQLDGPWLNLLERMELMSRNPFMLVACKKTRSVPIRGLLLAVAVTSIQLEAQISPTSPTSLWTAVAYATSFPDAFSDQQTGGKESDIVGNATHPSFYKLFYNGGTPANLTDGQLAFRLRLAQQENPPGYTGGAFVGLDGNADGALDIFIGVNNQGSGDKVGIWDAGTGLNTSPSTTTIESPPRFSYTPTAANYNWSVVTFVRDPAATTLDVDAGASTDYFLTWVVPFADVVAGFAANGITNFNENIAMGLVSATATQDNSLNQDLNGVAGSVNSSLTWGQLGAAALPYSANGTTPAPEPGSAALMLLALAVIGWRSRRR